MNMPQQVNGGVFIPILSSHHQMYMLSHLILISTRNFHNSNQNSQFKQLQLQTVLTKFQ